MTEQPRPGEQPLPVPGKGVCIQDQIAHFLNQQNRHWSPELVAYTFERKELGIRRYGRALEAHNGRDAYVDAFEEAFDLMVYVAQAIVEEYGELPEPGELYPEQGTAPELNILLDLAHASFEMLGTLLIIRDDQLPEVPES